MEEFENMIFNGNAFDHFENVDSQEVFSLKMKEWLPSEGQAQYFEPNTMERITGLVKQFTYLYSGYGDYGEGTPIDNRSGYFFKIFKGDKRWYHMRVSLSNPFKVSITHEIPSGFIEHVDSKNEVENHKEVLEDMKTNLIQINKAKENLNIENLKKVDYTTIISMHSPDIADSMEGKDSSKEIKLADLEEKAAYLIKEIKAKELRVWR